MESKASLGWVAKSVKKNFGRLSPTVQFKRNFL